MVFLYRNNNFQYINIDILLVIKFKLFDNLVLIPEVNFSIKENNESNNTLAIRYLFNENKSIDLYYSNALSTHDLGQILKSEDYKYGIRLNLLNF